MFTSWVRGRRHQACDRQFAWLEKCYSLLVLLFWFCCWRGMRRCPSTCIMSQLGVSFLVAGFCLSLRKKERLSDRRVSSSSATDILIIHMPISHASHGDLFLLLKNNISCLTEMIIVRPINSYTYHKGFKQTSNNKYAWF